MKITYAFNLTAFAVVAQNNTKYYEPIIKEVEGWRIAVEPKLLEKENKEVADKAFVALANHLQRVKFILPEAKVKELQKLPIPVSYTHLTLPTKA